MGKAWNAYSFEDVFTDDTVPETISQSRVPCAYVTRTYRAGDMLEIDVFPAFLNRRDFSRAKKIACSTEKQKKMNVKNATRKLIRLVNANFGSRDLWMTFGYDDRHMPADEAQILADVRRYIRRVRRERAKSGITAPLRYIYVIEWGEHRPHVHLIMSGDMDRDVLERLWDKCERKCTRRIEPDDVGLSGLAAYISKDPHGRKRWGASVGLTQPIVSDSYRPFTRRTVERLVRNQNELAGAFEAAYQGYRYDEAHPCRVAYNEIIGLFYLTCVMYRRNRRE